ncbi:MAG: hypothetical protein QGI83_19775 [Candidatus Latescibacteria bacterium]|jgi:hypothetical protein|nr:hypothetical protein [Candidatus Latescibacterota bacterium]
MKAFSERDVRHHYDLLQHKPELGLTQLKAMDGENIIGIGLFDNEDDFVSECLRYNGLGSLHVGVNPRFTRLLDEFGGLKNRIRTLFLDVVGIEHIEHVTGIAVTDTQGISESASGFIKDASVLHEGETFFPMDKPIDIPEKGHEQIEGQISSWLYAGDPGERISVAQFVGVVGVQIPWKRWFGRRTKFRAYRPFILDDISKQVSGDTDGEGGAA